MVAGPGRARVLNPGNGNQEWKTFRTRQTFELEEVYFGIQKISLIRPLLTGSIAISWLKHLVSCLLLACQRRTLQDRKPPHFCFEKMRVALGAKTRT